MVARTLNARAVTIGNHILFDNRYYDTQSENGKALLRHELGYTIQQQNISNIPSQIILITRPSNHYEQEVEKNTQRANNSDITNIQRFRLSSSPQVSLSLCRTLVEAASWGITAALVALVATGCVAGSVVTVGGLAIPCTAVIVSATAMGAVDAVLWSNILKDTICGENNLASASATEATSTEAQS